MTLGSSRIIFLLFAIIMWRSTLSHAEPMEDIVFLKNGDRLSGHILSMEAEQLEIATTLAGTIKIDWDNIQRLQPADPLSLTFHEGAEIPDGIGTRDKDRVIVGELSADGPIRFPDVKAIGIPHMYQRGNVNLGGNQTSGNSNTQALNVSGSYTLRREWHRLQMDAIFNRGEANGQLTAQNAMATFKYDYLLTRQVFISGQELGETDKFQNLTGRSTTSLALGYDFYDRSARSLSIGTGPGLVYEHYTTEPVTVRPTVAWFVRWRQDMPGGIVTLFHNQTGFRDLTLRNATRLNAQQGVRVKVYGGIALNFEYDMRFNTDPAPGRKTVDSALIFGLSYGFEHRSLR